MTQQLAEVYIHEPDILQIKPNAKILDVTAGNRHIWGKNKLRDDVIFCDKETNLKIKPDVICKWTELPFKDNSFHCIVFDPPFYSGNAMPYFQNPQEDDKDKLRYFYGFPFKTKHELRIEILKAQREFARVAPRLCLKWMDRDLTVHQVLTLFIEWNPIWVQPCNGKHNFNNGSVWWVKLVRKEDYQK